MKVHVLPVLAMLLATNLAHGNDLEETMIAEESGDSLRYSVTRYTNDGRELHTRDSALGDMLQPKLSSMSIATPSSPSSNAYYRRALASGYAKAPKDVYKKAASEYWQHEVMPPHHGSSMVDEAGEGYGHIDTGRDYETMQGAEPYYGQDHGYHRGKEISITPDHKPITLHYRTHSQPIIVHQTRIPGPKPEVKHTTSHEEPHRVVHEVVRPIIQEVVEIIQPYRKITQEVRPVLEEIKTVVAKDAGRGHYGGHGGGYAQASSNALRPTYTDSDAPVLHASMKQLRKAAVFEYDGSAEDARESENRYTKIKRSKAYINRQGVPVYESKYLGPVSFGRS